MQTELNYRRALEYATQTVATLQADIWVKNAFLDDQRDIIEALRKEIADLKEKDTKDEA